MNAKTALADMLSSRLGNNGPNMPINQPQQVQQQKLQYQQQLLISWFDYIAIKCSICGHSGLNLDECENCGSVIPEEPAEQLEAPAIPDFSNEVIVDLPTAEDQEQQQQQQDTLWTDGERRLQRRASTSQRSNSPPP
jgi:hypothetical protein